MDVHKKIRRTLRNPGALRRIIAKPFLKAIYPPHHNSVVQVETADFAVLVRANEAVGRHILSVGSYEAKDARALRGLLRGGDICVDAGANTGFYTFLMATAVGEDGWVYAFEPIDLNAHLLSAGALINRLSNVTLERACLADRDGAVTFSIAEDSAFSSIRDTGRGGAVSNVVVPAYSLDSYLEQRRLKKADVLKIDVEGAEGLVLHGARTLLGSEDSRPRVLMIELVSANLRTFATTIDEICSVMRSAKYRAHVATSKGTFRPYTAEDHDVEENVFFFPS